MPLADDSMDYIHMDSQVITDRVENNTFVNLASVFDGVFLVRDRLLVLEHEQICKTAFWARQARVWSDQTNLKRVKRVVVDLIVHEPHNSDLVGNTER